MTNHSDPTRSNLLKRFIIFNKNTRYKGSDIRTSAVSKNRRKKYIISKAYFHQMHICQVDYKHIESGDQDKSRPHLLLVTSIVSPHLPARGLPCLPTTPATKLAPALSAAQCCDLILSLFFLTQSGKMNMLCSGGHSMYYQYIALPAVQCDCCSLQGRRKVPKI